MTQHSFNLSVLLLLIVAVGASGFWLKFSFANPTFTRGIKLIIAGNAMMIATAAALHFLPSNIKNQHLDIIGKTGYLSIVSGTLGIIVIALFRVAKQHLAYGINRFNVVSESTLAPILYVVVSASLVMHGFDTQIGMSITFEAIFLTVVYGTIFDIYSNDRTNVFVKFIESLPYKLIIIAEISHLIRLVNDEGKNRGGDEIQLMLSYSILMIALNATLYYQVKKILQPSRATKPADLSAV